MKTKTITSRSFAKRALMVLAVLFTTLTASATEFITDVMLIGTLEKTDKEALISKYQNEGWTLIEKDLNAGAGGDYIYLFYKSEANTDGVNHGYITDFYIYGSQNGNFEEEVTSGGRTYYLVPFDGSTAFKDSKGDLNRGCGKGTDYIHLYYTMDTQSDKAVSGIAFDNMQFNALGNMGLSGGISGYNLNAGCSSGENIYMHITTKNATTQTYKYIKYTYDTTNGLTKKEESCSGYHTVTSSTPTFNNGWYVLSSSQSFDNRITVSGTVNLILCDGCMLEAKKGIEVAEGNTLNIFAQSEGDKAGKLKATSVDFVAGIGGDECSGGTVTIYGGIVETHGGASAAGIGGGIGGSGGTVTIYGGIVKAHGGYDGAGIGSGYYGAGGTVTIYGGSVEAHGGTNGAGIGVGYTGAGGEVIIYGGTVMAHGGQFSAGIGGGYTCAGVTVSIYGGMVEANGGLQAAGIGAGEGGENNGTLKIGKGLKVYDIENPGTPLATGPQENVETRTQYMGVGKMFPVSYIEYSYNEDTKTLTSEKRLCDDYTEVTSGTTTFSNGWYVLSSNQSFDDRITVSGTVNLILCDGCMLEAKTGIKVRERNKLNIFAQSEDANAGALKAIATSDEFRAGIGGNNNESGGSVTIYGGKVEAYSGTYGAAIGGGRGGVGGTVTIYGGMVETHSGKYGAGIGGGNYSAGGTVTVYDGTVKAYSGNYGAGIGGGNYSAGGTVTIYGGTVEAHGVINGAGIGGGGGGGSNCAGGAVTIYGGMVEANGGYQAAGIGGGYNGAGGSVTIYGGTVEANGGNLAAGIGAGRSGDSHGTLKIGDGVKVYGGDSENPTTVIATGPKDNVESRPRYMIATDYPRGDANGDDKVNAADIVEMVNAKNGNASDKFVLKNADIDGSGKITKDDIDAVVKIIMQK